MLPVPIFIVGFCCWTHRDYCYRFNVYDCARWSGHLQHEND